MKTQWHIQNAGKWGAVREGGGRSEGLLEGKGGPLARPAKTEWEKKNTR